MEEFIDIFEEIEDGELIIEVWPTSPIIFRTRINQFEI